MKMVTYSVTVSNVSMGYYYYQRPLLKLKPPGRY